MFYQTFLSPQVKRCAIISYKHGIYELYQELSNDLRLRIVRNQEISGKLYIRKRFDFGCIPKNTLKGVLKSKEVSNCGSFLRAACILERQVQCEENTIKYKVATSKLFQELLMKDKLVSIHKSNLHLYIQNVNWIWKLCNAQNIKVSQAANT